jgi:carbonic anhydrase
MIPLQLFVLVLTMLPLLFIAWVYANPQAALEAVCELGERIDSWYARHYANNRSRHFWESFKRDMCAKGYQQAAIDVFVQAKQAEVHDTLFRQGITLNYVRRKHLE